MKVVIIGYGTAGMTAAGFIRIYGREREITVVEKRPYPIYHPCSIPDVIAGKIPSWNSIMEETRQNHRFRIYAGTLVEDVDSTGKKVFCRDLKSGKKFVLEYDVLVLAIGSIPRQLRTLPGSDLNGIYTLKTVEDGVSVHKRAIASTSAAVVGAGPLGVETAFALRELGLKVTLIEIMPTILPGKFDPDMSKNVEKFLLEKGIRVVTGSRVVEFQGRNWVNKVLTENNVFEADLVVLSVGTLPNVELARIMGLALGPTGGIKVDENMKTSVNDVYSAGDCTEVWDAIEGKPALPMLANAAYQQGRVAGLNISGIKEKYEGTLYSWAISLGGFNAGAVGLTYAEAKKRNLKAKTVKMTSTFKPIFYPDSSQITLKIVFDEEKILGAQILGEVNISYILNFFALAVKRKIPIKDLSKLEPLYVPNLVDLPDPIFKILESALRRIKRQIF